MRNYSTKTRAGDLIPGFFIGSPIALVLPGLLMYGMPIGWALLVGAVVGLGAGVALIGAIRRSA